MFRFFIYMAILDGFFSLGENINKVKDTQKDYAEGIVSDILPEMSLDMTDDELLQLKNKWEKSWKPYAQKISSIQQDNEDYWLGKVKNVKEVSQYSEKPNADNVIFESVETLIPLITRQNPEPVVDCDNSTEGNILADKVAKMLKHLADRLDLKLTTEYVVRNWCLYFLGAMKVSWSMKKNEIRIDSIRPQKLVLDPDASIINGEYTGQYIGEVRKDTAANIIRRFPKVAKELEDQLDGKMGTEMNYTEWWTDDYLFWTLKDMVLNKVKNPHWNYDSQKEVYDEFGNVTVQATPGRNQFKTPQKPYIFLSVFNLGRRPFDDTNLVHQNQAIQDMISKRLKQIDRNADSTNGGITVSGDYFTKEQAALVSDARRRGDTVWVPTGDVNAAYKQDSAPPLPQFVYQSLMDYRTELKNNFGIRGVSAGGTATEKTVRGKIISRSQDADRLSTMTKRIEQVYDNAFNWMVQMMYVYYDEPHVASVIGKERAKEYISIQNSDLDRDVTISVREGSLIPKDPLTVRNEAIDLWSAGAIDPITLFERLDDPNPRETARRLFIWKSDPIALFPDLMAQKQAQQAQQAPQPMPGMPPQAQPMPQEPQLGGQPDNQVDVPLTQIHQ